MASGQPTLQRQSAITDLDDELDLPPIGLTRGKPALPGPSAPPATAQNVHNPQQGNPQQTYGAPVGLSGAGLPQQAPQSMSQTPQFGAQQYGNQPNPQFGAQQYGNQPAPQQIPGPSAPPVTQQSYNQQPIHDSRPPSFGQANAPQLQTPGFGTNQQYQAPPQGSNTYVNPPPPSAPPQGSYANPPPPSSAPQRGTTYSNPPPPSPAPQGSNPQLPNLTRQQTGNFGQNVTGQFGQPAQAAQPAYQGNQGYNYPQQGNPNMGQPDSFGAPNPIRFTGDQRDGSFIVQENPNLRNNPVNNPINTPVQFTGDQRDSSFVYNPDPSARNQANAGGYTNQNHPNYNQPMNPQQPNAPVNQYTPQPQNVPQHMQYDPRMINIEQIYARIAASVRERNINHSTLFDRYNNRRNDPSQSITLLNFEQALSFVPQNPGEIVTVGRQFLNQYGDVQFVSFLQRLDQEMQTSNVYNKIMQELKNHVSARQIDFVAEFRQFDAQGINKITKNDLSTFLSRIGFSNMKNYSEINIFINQMRFENGMVDCAQLLAEVAPVSTARATMKVEDIIKKICLYLEKTRRQPRALFDEFNREKDNQMRPTDMLLLLKKCEMNVNQQDVYNLAQVMGNDKQALITFINFNNKLNLHNEGLANRTETDVVFQKIYQYLQNTGQHLIDFFKEQDVTSTSSLDRNEFANTLRILNIHLAQQEFNALMQAMDYNNSGHVDYNEFAQQYQKTVDRLLQTGVLKAGPGRTIPQIAAAIKQAISGRQLREVFNIIQHHRTGEQVVDWRSFESGLRDYGVNLTQTEMQQLQTNLDSNRDGLIPIRTLDPLIGATSYQTTSTSQHWAQPIFQRILSFVQQRRQNLSQTLRDYANGGRMNQQQFEQALLYMQIDRQHIDGLFREFGRGGFVDLNTFLYTVEGKKLRTPQQILQDIAGYLRSSQAHRLRDIIHSDRDGWVIRQQLEQGFQIMRLQLTPEEVQDFICHVNPALRRQQSGNQIDYRFRIEDLESLLGLRQSDQPVFHIGDHIQKQQIYRQIAELVINKRISLEQQYFTPQDRELSAKISAQQMLGILTQLTENRAAQPALNLVVKEYTDPHSGVVSYQPFIKRIEQLNIAKSFLDDYLPRLRSTTQGKRLYDKLRAQDHNQDGFISKKDVFETLRTIGAHLSHEELDRLAPWIDSDLSGKISYSDLCKKIDGPAGPQNSPGRRPDPIGLPNPDVTYPQQPVYTPQFPQPHNPTPQIQPPIKPSIDNINVEQSQELPSLAPGRSIRGAADWAERIFVQIQAYASQQRMSVTALLNSFDTRNTKELSFPEFQNAIKTMNIQMTADDQNKLIMELDTTRDGTVCLDELFRRIEGLPKLNPMDRIRNNANSVINNLFTKIKGHIDSAGIHLLTLFKEMDRNNDNYITRQEFFSLFNSRIHMQFQPDELNKIFDVIDYNNDGRVNYTEFVNTINSFTVQPPPSTIQVPEPDLSHRRQTASFGMPSEENHWAEAHFAKVRSYLNQYKMTVRDLFAVGDVDSNMSVEAHIFIKAQERCGVNLHGPDGQRLVNELDVKRTGKVSVTEFERILSHDGSTQKWMEEFVKSIRSTLQADARATFDSYDTNGSNYLTVEQFKQALNRLCPQISPLDADRLSEYLDPMKSSKVYYSRFLDQLTLSFVENINRHIREFVEKNNIPLQQIFSRYDNASDGYITTQQMHMVLNELRVPLTEDEIWQVINENQLFLSVDGRVSFRDLLERLQITQVGMRASNRLPNYEGHIPVPLDESQMGRSLPGSKPMNVSMHQSSQMRILAIYNKIKGAVESAQINLLQQWVDYDKMRSGEFGKIDLERVLDSCKAGIDPTELESIFDDLDPGRYNKISYHQLVQKVNAKNPTLSAVDLVWAKPILDDIASKLSEQKISAYGHFTQYRIYPDNTMMTIDFKRSLDVLKLAVNFDQLNQLTEKFRQGSDDKIMYKQFEQALNTHGQVSIMFEQEVVPGTRSAPVAAQRSIRKLTANQEEHVLQCFDYIAKQIKKDKTTIQALTDPFNKQGYITWQELKDILELHLKIPSYDENFGQIVLYLTDQTGNIPVKDLVEIINDTATRVTRSESRLMTSPDKKEALAESSVFSPYIDHLAVFLLDENITMLSAFGKPGGTIPVDNFKHSLTMIKYNVQLGSLNGLIHDMQEGQSMIQLDRLKLQIDLKANTSRSASSYRPQPPNQKETNEVLDALEERLRFQKITPEDAFNMFNISNSGYMTQEEFNDTFTRLNLKIPTMTLSRVFSVLDADGSGKLSVREFLAKLPGAQQSKNQQISQIRLSKDLDNELMQLFMHFDVDGDVNIDKEELAQVFRAYGQFYTPQQLDKVFQAMDTDGNGKIQFSEFKAVMEERLKEDILQKEMDVADIRKKFAEADVGNKGALSKKQLKHVFVKMGVTLTNAELMALAKVADRNEDNMIDIDEFMYIMSGADQSILADENVSSALLSIRRSKKLKPADFLNLFSAMPGHFQPSFIAEELMMKRQLPDYLISPTIDSSGLKFKDVIYVDISEERNLESYLLKPKFEIGGCLTITKATGVSSVDTRHTQNHRVVKRFLRITFFDQITQEYVGNSTILEDSTQLAPGKTTDNDIWNFQPQSQERDTNKLMFRTLPKTSRSNIYMIFEFVMLVKKQEMLVEISCGYAKLNVGSLNQSISGKTMEITGGSPFHEVSINPKDVHTLRKGFGAKAKKAISGIRSELSFSFKKYGQLKEIEEKRMDCMPTNTVIPKLALHIVALFRNHVAKTIAEMSHGQSMVPELSDTLITQFPKIMNCPDLWRPLLFHWNSHEFNSLKIRGKTEQEALYRLKELASRLYVVMSSNTFHYEDFPVFTFIDDPVAGERVRCVKSALDGVGFENLTYKPFDISEVMASHTLDMARNMGYKFLSLTQNFHQSVNT